MSKVSNVNTTFVTICATLVYTNFLELEHVVTQILFNMLFVQFYY